jgi:phage shock protein PspC (stress-responsive transcriptional regulator)
MEMYGLPATLLRTVFVLLAVVALLERDHVAVSSALIIVAAFGLLGFEVYLRHHAGGE